MLFLRHGSYGFSSKTAATARSISCGVQSTSNSTGESLAGKRCDDPYRVVHGGRHFRTIERPHGLAVGYSPALDGLRGPTQRMSG
jgi:hypothetical protein